MSVSELAALRPGRHEEQADAPNGPGHSNVVAGVARAVLRAQQRVRLRARVPRVPLARAATAVDRLATAAEGVQLLPAALAERKRGPWASVRAFARPLISTTIAGTCLFAAHDWALSHMPSSSAACFVAGAAGGAAHGVATAALRGSSGLYFGRRLHVQAFALRSKRAVVADAIEWGVAFGCFRLLRDNLPSEMESTKHSLSLSAVIEVAAASMGAAAAQCVAAELIATGRVAARAVLRALPGASIGMLAWEMSTLMAERGGGADGDDDEAD